MARITFKAAAAELRAQGVSLNRTAVAGEFRVSLAGAPKRHAGTYYTDDLADALATGKHMGRERATAAKIGAAYGSHRPSPL